MSWIDIKCKKISTDEKLLTLGVEPKEDDFYWAVSYIRSEDIAEFYSLTDNKIIISFYDDRTKVVIREKIEDFYKRMQKADYDANSLNLDDEKISTL